MTAPVSPSAPVAWRLVPVEPSDEMMRAGYVAIQRNNLRDAWEAMLAASPAPSMVGLRAKVAEMLAKPGVFSRDNETAHRAASPYAVNGVRDEALAKADAILALLAREGE